LGLSRRERPRSRDTSIAVGSASSNSLV
jgi:hypothetical protein